VNPARPLEYFEELSRAIKARSPVHIHVSPVEMIYRAKVSGLSQRRTTRHELLPAA
jgi:hypothetical protein